VGYITHLTDPRTHCACFCQINNNDGQSTFAAPVQFCNCSALFCAVLHFVATELQKKKEIRGALSGNKRCQHINKPQRHWCAYVFGTDAAETFITQGEPNRTADKQGASCIPLCVCVCLARVCVCLCKRADKWEVGQATINDKSNFGDIRSLAQKISNHKKLCTNTALQVDEQLRLNWAKVDSPNQCKCVCVRVSALDCCCHGGALALFTLPCTLLLCSPSLPFALRALQQLQTHTDSGI